MHIGFRFPHFPVGVKTQRDEMGSIAACMHPMHNTHALFGEGNFCPNHPL